MLSIAAKLLQTHVPFTFTTLQDNVLSTYISKELRHREAMKLPKITQLGSAKGQM